MAIRDYTKDTDEETLPEFFALVEKAKEAAAVVRYMRDVLFNHPVNRLVATEYVGRGVPHFSGVDWRFSWINTPISISVFEADSEWVAEHVLSVLRSRYGNDYTMEIWEDIQKVVYKTTVLGFPVVIQVIGMTECKWKEVNTTTYKLDCGGAE